MPEISAITRAAAITAADAGARTLTVQLLRWDEPRVIRDPGRPPYTETWARGSLVPLDDLYAVDRHGGELIGRMDHPVDAGAGPSAAVHIAHTRAGDDLLALVDAGVIRSVSIEAIADPRAGEIWSPDHQSVTRTRAHLAGVAFAFRGALDAPILARALGGPMPPMPDPNAPPADTGTPTPGHTDVLDDILRALQSPDQAAGGTPASPPSAAPAPAPAPPAPAPVPAAPAAPALPPLPQGSAADQIARALAERAQPGNDQLRAEVDVLRNGMVELIQRQTRPTTYRYTGWGELLRASARGELADADLVALNRAIVDITTGDIPGLIPRPVVAQIMDVIANNQQLADAAGTVPFPDSGMTIDFPQVTARPEVAQQANEKTEVRSVKTHVARGSVPVVTLAGGEDVSIQAILRSSPSYLELVGQLYLEAMAIATDLYAWSIYGPAVPAPHVFSIGADPAGWNQALFDAAGKVLTDGRVLPNRLVLSTDLWSKVGGAADAEGRPLFTTRSPMNPMGTASLTSTEGEVRELPWAVDPNLPPDTGAMFADSAFRSSLGAVSTITADVPTKLGRDYAVYRFGAFLVVNAEGLAKIQTAAIVPLEGRGAKKS